MIRKRINKDMFFTEQAFYIKKDRTSGILQDANPAYLCRCSPVFPVDSDMDIRAKTESAEARYVVYIESVRLRLSWSLKINNKIYGIERVNDFFKKDFKEVILTFTPESVDYV